MHNSNSGGYAQAGARGFVEFFGGRTSIHRTAFWGLKTSLGGTMKRLRVACALWQMILCARGIESYQLPEKGVVSTVLLDSVLDVAWNPPGEEILD